MPSMTRRRLLIAGTALAGISTKTLRAGPRSLKRFNRSGRALGTQVSITVLHDRAAAAEAALNAAFEVIERVEDVMSVYRPESQISRLNRHGLLNQPHPQLIEVLRHAQALSQRTAGAFDITVQPLWRLFAEAKRQGQLPDDAAVAEATATVDYRRVEITDARIRLRGPGTAVTLNGIAQGYAADAVRRELYDRGIRHAMIDTGEIESMGTKEAQAPWTVGIQHPRRTSAYCALADLDGRALATSGDYATPFSADLRHHHLFDPKSGRSPGELSSVSIAAPTAMQADALSTAVFVLGPAAGWRLAMRTPGVDAMLILKDGRARHTPGFPMRSS